VTALPDFLAMLAVF